VLSEECVSSFGVHLWKALLGTGSLVVVQKRHHQLHLSPPPSFNGALFQMYQTLNSCKDSIKVYYQ